MATFSDMVTLLLAFFVMIVAMSEVEVKKFERALSYFTGQTGVFQYEAILPEQDPSTTRRFKSRERAKRFEELQRFLKENDLEDKVQVHLTNRGVHAIITDSVMFNSGRATLIEPSRTILRHLSKIIGHDDAVKAVIVEGHTDDRPIHTARFPSNWELSTARAASVVRFLLEQEHTLTPAQYVPLGYGEFHPRTTNETPEGRAHNRRVEILFSWEPWQNHRNLNLEQTTLPTTR